MVWVVSSVTYSSSGLSWRFVGGELGEEFVEVLSGELPLERASSLLVVRLESEEAILHLCEVGEVVGGKDGPLDDREVDFDLVEPAGVDGRMNLNGIGVPVSKTLDGWLTTMGRTIVGHPEDPTGRSIGFLGHDLIDQTVKPRNASARFASSEHFGAMNIPSGDVGQGTTPLVFMFDASGSAWCGRQGGNQAMASLDAGLFVRADHVFVRKQWDTVPETVVQVQHHAGLLFKARVPRPDPTAIAPRADGIRTEPSPNRRTTDRSHNATLDRVPCDLRAGKTRKRQPQVFGQLACQRFNLDDDLRGEKRAGVRALAVLEDRPDVPQRSACATSRRSGGGRQDDLRSPYWRAPRRQGGQPWLA